MRCQIVVVSLIALFLPRGDAIKCYQCSSATDPKCGDPIDTSLPQVDCTPAVVKEADAFLKSAADTLNSALGKIGVDTDVKAPSTNLPFTCVKAVKQENDKKLVIRSCSIPKQDKFDVCENMKGQGLTFCESCEKDGCNSASSLPTSLFLVLAAALAAYFFSSK